MYDNNSMGHFKENVGHMKEYGEAVIEVRAIRDISPWWLKRCGFDESIKRIFLVYPTQDLIIQTKKLFKFLSSFGSQKDYQDVALGMSFALRKYDC